VEEKSKLNSKLQCYKCSGSSIVSLLTRQAEEARRLSKLLIKHEEDLQNIANQLEYRESAAEVRSLKKFFQKLV
jgi:hypothetical protein